MSSTAGSHHKHKKHERHASTPTTTSTQQPTPSSTPQSPQLTSPKVQWQAASENTPLPMSPNLISPVSSLPPTPVSTPPQSLDNPTTGGICRTTSGSISRHHRRRTQPPPVVVVSMGGAPTSPVDAPSPSSAVNAFTPSSPKKSFTFGAPPSRIDTVKLKILIDRSLGKECAAKYWCIFKDFVFARLTKGEFAHKISSLLSVEQG